MRRVGAVAGFTALSIALTWPLALSPASRVPLGTEAVATVPALNVWTVWWNADRAGRGFGGYWHAPIFHPARYAFAFSEAQPTTLLVAPLVSLEGPVLAYNVYLLAVLTLNGVAAFGLLRRVGLMTVPALFGGAMAEALPFAHWQLGVVQLATLCGVLWVMDRLVALRDVPTVLNSVLLGGAAALCYAACNYWGLYLSALVPLAAAPLLWGRWRDWRFWSLSVLAGVLAAGACAPILWAQWKAKTVHQWERPESLLVNLSALPRDYLTTPWQPAVASLDLVALKDRARPLWMLGPGAVKFGLAAAGAAAGLLMHGRRRWTLFLVLLLGWAFVLSLGPRLEVFDGYRLRMRPDADAVVTGWVPYRVAIKVHPGLALARSPFRFAFFVQTAAVLLAANLFDGVWAGAGRLTRDWRRRPRQIGFGFASAAVIALGVFAVAEVWPARQRLYEPPSLDQAWVRWLRDNTERSRAIVALPFPTGSRVEDYERTAVFMYEQIGHRRPLVQGYSGFFPDDFLALKDRIPSFPSDGLLNELRGRGARHVVATTPEWVTKAEGSARLRLEFRDKEAKVSIYSILPAADVPEGESAE